MMTIKGFPSSLPESEIKGLLETIGQVSGRSGSPIALYQTKSAVFALIRTEEIYEVPWILAWQP